MSFNNLADPILIVWHTDGAGNKITIPRNNEDYVVVNHRILLDYIPDKFQGITFSTPASMVEIPLRNAITVATEYKVDYTNGLIYLHEDLEATTVTVSYSSRGIISYPASRVYTVASGLTVTETLQQRIDYLLTVGGNYDSAESSRVSAENIRVNSENTRLSNESTRINSEDIRISQEDTRISQEDTRQSNESNRITTFNTFLNNKDIDWDNFKDDKDDEWEEFTHKGDYSGSIAYKRFNIVKSSTTTHMAIQDTTAGISPSNSAYWRPIAINGDNFTPRGIYNAGTAYSQYDIVTYQNGIYMAKGSTTGNVPTNTTYWDVYLSLDALEILYQDVIADSTVETTYTGTELTSVTWKDANTTDVIRTDTYTYAEDSTTETITELRTIAGSGETLEIVSVFDLDGNFISGTNTSNA